MEQILEALRFSRNGQLDVYRIAVTGVLFGGFVLWRLLGGTSGATQIMRIIEQDLTENFQQVERVSAAGEAPDPAIFNDIEVSFSNVSMSAPITSWEVNEDVVVRFDYALKVAGTTRQQDTDRYVRVARRGPGLVYESGPFGYYINLLF